MGSFWRLLFIAAVVLSWSSVRSQGSGSVAGSGSILILSTLRDTVEEGSILTLTCTSDSIIAADFFSLRRDGVFIGDNTRLSTAVDAITNRVVFTISPVTAGDAGEYQCVAEFPSNFVRVTVVPAAINLTISSSKPLSVLLGDYISLNCSSTPPAGMDISYTWTHLNTSTVLQETSNILTFSRISVEELGTYRCSATSNVPHFPAEVTITSARPLITTGSYPARINHGSCPSAQSIDDVTVDILQLLSTQFGVRPLGLTMSYAAESCDQVAEANPDSPPGMYWIYDDGNLVQVFCQ